MNKVLSYIQKFFDFIHALFVATANFFRNMKIVPRKKKRRSKTSGRDRVDAWCLFWFPFLFLYLELMIRVLTDVSFFAHLFYPLAFGFAFGMLCSLLIMFFKAKIVRVITIVLTSFLCFVYTLFIIVYNNFGSFMTIGSLLKGTGNVVQNYTGDVLAVMGTYFYVILIGLVPIVFYCLLGKRTFTPHRYKWPMAVYFVLVSLLLFGITTFFAAVGSCSDKYGSRYNFSTATETFGLTASLRLDSAYAGRTASFNVITDDTDEEDTEAANDDASAETTAAVIDYGENIMTLDFDALAASTDDSDWKELDAYVETLSASDKNEYTGLFKGKNLILICAEALSDKFINADLTPTLYRLIHNGFYFSDYYQPAWGGSTSTGEFSFLIGLAPTNAVDTIYETIGSNMYFTMGNQLQRLNYYNIAMHNGSYDFYDRDQTHNNLGYGTWTAIGNGLENITTHEWCGDNEFFDMTMDTYLDKQPFSIYYMSASGHCTYDADDEKTLEYLDQVSQYYGDLLPTTQYYICYQMEFEKALTTMVQKLEDAGIADDTVIAITTDHYPYGLEYGSFGNTEDYISDLYGYTVDTDWGRDSNCLIIWSGCLENDDKDMACEISTPVYSLDILPTLSNLFGLEYDSRLLVGRDVFSDEDPLVFWLDYSWKTDKGLYDSSTGTFTAAEGAQISDESAYVDKINQIVDNKINFSRTVIATDYYRHLFGEDTDTSSNG